MNHRHRKILHQIFAHPVNPNLHFHDIETIFTELGADLGHSGSSRLQVKLNSHVANFHVASHALPKQKVIQVRKFVETCGVEPDRDYPL